MRKVSLLLALVGAALLAGSFLPVSVDDRGTMPVLATAAMPDPVAQGIALFRAKGCASCHRHDAVGAGTLDIGPDLSHYKADPAFVRRWLQDPAAVRPGTRMPNLQLKPAEIEALIALLQSNRALIDLSEQARELAREEVPDPVLRQLITDLRSTSFIFTDKAATVEVDVSIPEPAAPPENWNVKVLSVAKLVSHIGAELELDSLKVGPHRVVREMLEHWPGCTVQSMMLVREQDVLRWIGFCNTSQGVVSGYMDNYPGIFWPSAEPPAHAPVTATPGS